MCYFKRSVSCRGSLSHDKVSSCALNRESVSCSVALVGAGLLRLILSSLGDTPENAPSLGLRGGFVWVLNILVFIIPIPPRQPMSVAFRATCDCDPRSERDTGLALSLSLSPPGIGIISQRFTQSCSIAVDGSASERQEGG